MLKKLKTLTVLVLFNIFFAINANALGCLEEDINDLRSYANQVKVNYDIIDNSKKGIAVTGEENEEFIIPDFSFNISVLNITDNIYISIRNNKTTDLINVYNKDTENGIYRFNEKNFTDVYNYTIEIRSNNPYCMHQTIKQIKFIKPKYNPYSAFKECRGSDLIYCQKFISIDKNISLDEFISRVNNDKENTSLDENTYDTTLLEKYRYILLISLFLIIVTIILVLIVRKYKKGKEEWKL